MGKKPLVRCLECSQNDAFSRNLKVFKVALARFIELLQHFDAPFFAKTIMRHFKGLSKSEKGAYNLTDSTRKPPLQATS